MFMRVKEVLEKVGEELDDPKIYDIPEEQRKRFKKNGDELPEPLPALVARYKGRQVNLDFVPWDGKRYVRILDISLRSPFEMFIERKGGERGLHVMRTRVPLSDIEWGDDEFKQNYIVQSCLLPTVQKFLKSKTSSKLINKLLDFEKVTIDLRYIRIYHFIEIGKKVSSRKIMTEIKTLARLADIIEGISNNQ